MLCWLHYSLYDLLTHRDANAIKQKMCFSNRYDQWLLIINHGLYDLLIGMPYTKEGITMMTEWQINFHQRYNYAYKVRKCSDSKDELLLWKNLTTEGKQKINPQNIVFCKNIRAFLDFLLLFL